MISSKVTCCFVATLLVLASFAQAKPQDYSVPSSESLYKTAVDYVKDIATSIKDKGLIPEDLQKDKLYIALKDSVVKTSDKFTENLKKFDKESKTYNEDFQKNVGSLQKQLNEVVKSIGNRDFQGKTEKLYDTVEQQFKDISLKAAELSKTAGLPEQYQSTLKEVIESSAQLSKKVKGKLSEIATQQSATKA